MSLAAASAEVDTDRLGFLEETIERGIGTFVEVGNALTEIRDAHLYRDSYATFDAYCRGRWSFTDRRARQLMDAAAITGLLSIGTAVPVSNEAQARELAPLRDDLPLLREAWATARQRADELGVPVTAPLIRSAVREHVRSEAAASEAELQEATATWTPEQKAAVAPERMRQQGELMRLTGDITHLPDPVGYARSHRDLPVRVIDQAEGAHAWLTDFLTEWRHRGT